MNIDIIIPCFNRSTTLPRAIESVLKQTYLDYNLFIIDDGSTDDTETQISPYIGRPNIHYLKQQNQGVSAARNLGIAHSKALWISFLDSDDEWLPQKLQTQVTFARDNPTFRFIHSNEIWIRNGQRVNPKQRFDKSNLDIFRRSLETCLISPSTVMMRRDLGEEHGFFDPSFPVCEDYDLWLKILAREEVGFIPEHLVKKYGGHEDQLSKAYPAMDFWRIRSLIQLFNEGTISVEKRNQIEQEIQRKAPLLLQGYEKHQNSEKHRELSEMLGKLRR